MPRRLRYPILAHRSFLIKIVLSDSSICLQHQALILNSLKGQSRGFASSHQKFQQTNKLLQSIPTITATFKENVNWINSVYERAFGIAEIRNMQSTVLAAEGEFVGISQKRRVCQDEIERIKEEIKGIRDKLDITPRQSDNYLKLITQEHQLLREQLALDAQLTQLRESEQLSLDNLSKLLRQSHELERLRQERAKYWQIISIALSVAGSLLALIAQRERSQKTVLKELNMHGNRLSNLEQLVETIASQNNQMSSRIESLSRLLNNSIQDRKTVKASHKELQPKRGWIFWLPGMATLLSWFGRLIDTMHGLKLKRLILRPVQTNRINYDVSDRTNPERVRLRRHVRENNLLTHQNVEHEGSTDTKNNQISANHNKHTHSKHPVSSTHRNNDSTTTSSRRPHLEHGDKAAMPRVHPADHPLQTEVSQRVIPTASIVKVNDHFGHLGNLTRSLLEQEANRSYETIAPSNSRMINQSIQNIVILCCPIIALAFIALMFWLVFQLCRKIQNSRTGSRAYGSKQKEFSSPVAFISGGKFVKGSQNNQTSKCHDTDTHQLTINMETESGAVSNDVVHQHPKSTFRGKLSQLGRAKPSSGTVERSLGQLKYALSYDFEQAALSVTVFEASNLPRMDLGGSSDPYVKIRLIPGGQSCLKTRVHKRTLNPIFNESFKIPSSYSDIQNATLSMTVYDHDRVGSHDEIGEVRIPMNTVDLSQTIEEWSPLKKVDGSTKQLLQLGELCLSLRYVPTAGKLNVVVIEARRLKKMDFGGLSDPYVKLTLLNNGERVKKKKTSVKKCTLNPHYNESFSFEVPLDQIQTVQMLITVIDYDRFGTSEPIGRILLGCNSTTETEEQHWMDMVNSPRRPIAQWHTLKPVDIGSDLVSKERQDSPE